MQTIHDLLRSMRGMDSDTAATGGPKALSQHDLALISGGRSEGGCILGNISGTYPKTLPQ